MKKVAKKKGNQKKKPDTQSGQLNDVGVAVVEQKDKDGFNYLLSAGPYSIAWDSLKVARQGARELSEHIRVIRDLAVRRALLEREGQERKAEPGPTKQTKVKTKARKAKAERPAMSPPSAETAANSSHAA